MNVLRAVRTAPNHGKIIVLNRSAFAMLLLVAIAVALAACAGETDDAADGSGGSPGESSDAPGNDDAAGGARPALPPSRSVDDEAVDAEPRSFEEALYDETDGSFHVIYSTGVEPCHALAQVEVVEEPDQVTVTLHEGHVPAEDGEPQECILIAEQVSAEVALSEPLDGRTVVDGATGDEVPVDVIDAEDAPAS